eukprot:EG_transcript_1298
MALMTAVFVFVLSTVRQRLGKPTWWQRYGPLCLVSLAIPLIVADLWRHLLQDRALTVLDPLALLLGWAAVAAFLTARAAFTQKRWGPFGVPSSPLFRSFYFQQLPMLLVLLASWLVLAGHATDGWFGATRLDWPECGDNPTFNRVNQTWSTACTWSSSQYHCENVCCVPGGDGSRGVVDVATLPGGHCGCSCIADDRENLRHLSPIGILFTLLFTYAGFALLAVGTLWNASIGEKLREVRAQWRRLRGGGGRPQADSPLPAGPYDPPAAIVELGGDDGQQVFDVVVIGGGSGGLACAKACAALGRTAAVVDFVSPSPQGTTWGLGGTCVNVGCIPKKLMHEAGLRGHRRAGDAAFGWPEPGGAHSWTVLRANVQAYIRELNNGYEEELKDKGITYINARAAFAGPHTLDLHRPGQPPTQLHARHVVLAMGGRPAFPAIPGAAEYGVTSDDLFSLDRDPGAVVVVGASYVALECAGFLAETGHRVTVLMRSIPLRGFDQQMAELVVADLASRGVRVLRGAVPTRLTAAAGRRQLYWQPVGEDAEHCEECDTVVFAVGRRPCTLGLGLDQAGVQLSAGGKVLADKWGRTTAAHVYAIGDIVEGGLELTPVAIRAGQCVAQRLFGTAAAPVSYRNVPTTVFTPLEYGCVGHSEESAIEQYGADQVEVFHAELRPLEWALSPADRSCYVKLICHIPDDLLVVGFHLLSPAAGEVTQGVAVALQAGVRKRHFDAALGIHPTLAEAVTALTVTKRSAASAAPSGKC